MTRRRKWLLGIGAAVAVVVLALVLFLAWLLYTQAGLRFALDRGVGLMHGNVAYSQASGTLAGEATVNGLAYRDAAGDTVRVARATIDLQPWALLGRTLHVRKARIEGVTVALAPPQPAKASGGLSLQPPLTIVLDDTRIDGIGVSRAGKPVFNADSLALAGRWSSSALVVRQLALRAPQGTASLQGTLALAPGHRGHGKATFDWRQGDTRYAGELTSTSDGHAARLHANLRAPIAVTLAASLQLDAARDWTLSLQVPAFDADALPALPASLRNVALDLSGSGNRHGGQLAGKLVVNGHVVLIDPARFRYDGKLLTLDPLRLRSPAMPGVAEATGSVELAATPPAASLDVQWHDVQLPADLVGQVLATHGEAHVSGNLDHFALKGALALGPPGRLADINVALTGTPAAIELETLKLVQKQGGLDAHGRIGLAPRISWQLEAVADRFDPGAILAGWNGALNFHLASDGHLSPDGPVATLKLDRARGSLRGRSIAGTRADLRITPRNLLDGSLTLVAGGSRIHAAGKPGNRTDAAIEIDVASLGDWLPDAAGELHGHFTARGAWPKLAVNGALQGSALRRGAQRIDTLRLTASIPDTSQPGGDLVVALTGIHLDGLDFDSVHLEGHGTAASHRLQLAATGDRLGFSLDLHGHWRAARRQWTGTLSDITLSPAELPEWHQQQASTLTWQHGTFSMSRLCLASGEPRLCLAAKRDARGTTSADFSLHEWPLQMLATLAPGPHPLQATGTLSGEGAFTLDRRGALRGHAQLAASEGRIAYASTPQAPLLAWTAITLDATAAGSDQHVILHGALAEGGRIDADVKVRGTDHALAGSLDVDLRSLAFLAALSPEVANVQGTLTGALHFGGTLAAPRFDGRMQTHGFSAEIPRAGLKLHDGEFAVSGDEQGQLALQGQVTSGKGVLHVDGRAGLAADAPLALTIKGENVLVADIPAAHVVASPDLQIGRDKGVYSVTGTLAIPQAAVALAKLPGQGPAKASPDVVIVDEPPAAEVAPLAVKANITVTLGDDVEVSGYGLDGRVHGRLAVLVRPDGNATGRGEISVEGKYQAYGQNLTIERGRLLFAGTPLDNPGLDIRAVRKIRSADVTVGLSVRGTARQPILTVISDPAMEQAEALSYLVTGRPLDQLNSGEGDTLNTAAQALGGLAGDRLAKSIGSRLGLEAGVASSEALGGSAFTAGKYLSPRLFLSYGVGLFTPGQVITLRFTINRFLQFEAEDATTGNRASLNYRIEK